MKNKKLYILSYIFSILIGYNTLVSQVDTMSPGIHADLIQTQSDSTSTTTEPEIKIWFQYQNKPLSQIVHEIGSYHYNPVTHEKGISIIQPTGPNALTMDVTFSIPHQITLSEAWSYLLQILNIAGYTLETQKDVCIIKKNDKTSSKDSLPFFINVATSDLPAEEMKIIYLRYLKNMQVPGAAGSQSTLQTILQNMLPQDTTLFFDPQTNAVIIIDSTNNIRHAMEIIDAFDNNNYWEQEALVLSLQYVNAAQVKSLFDELIPQNTSVKASGYFHTDTKVIVESRKNMVIVLGKKEHLARVKDFITTYIDVPIGKGKSILHVYTLKYLQAETFVSTLLNIVQDQSTGNSGQSTSSGPTGGPQQYFKGVIITPENSQSSGDGTGSVQGGNRLIIAAVESDWLRIKKLIDELDQPQLQIIIKGLIADMTYQDQKNFGSQIRNYTGMFMDNVNWQAGHIGGIETNTAYSTQQNPNPPSNPDALRANLLSTVSSGYTSPGNIASNATAGSFIMSFTDPNVQGNGIWLVTQILTQSTDSKILYQPFLITTNNTSVTFTDGSTKKIPGQASQQFGVEVQEQQLKDANTTITCTPRISQNGTVNLTLNIGINEWTDNTNQTNRSFVTNVNIKNGDILVIGGMTRNRIENSVSETPFFSQLPFGVGNLFKNRSKVITTTNLMTFFQVEVIHPMQQSNKISNQVFATAKGIMLAPEENFSSLKDPISHWFFGKDDRNNMPEQALKIFIKDSNDPSVQTTTVAQASTPETTTVETLQEVPTKAMQMAQADEMQTPTSLHTLLNDGELDEFFMNKKYIKG